MTFLRRLFLLVLSKYGLIKTKILRASHILYMTKTLRKAIMKRTGLETKYLKNKTDINLKAYKKQRNSCSKLYKKERKKYYIKLNMISITDNEEFGRTIKSFLSDEVTAQTRRSLVEKDKLFSNERNVAETFSNSFENHVYKLGISRDDAKFNDEPVLSTNPLDIAIQKFNNHSGVKLIRDNITNSDIFQFESVSLDDILKEITNLKGIVMKIEKAMINIAYAFQTYLKNFAFQLFIILK